MLVRFHPRRDFQRSQLLFLAFHQRRQSREIAQLVSEISIARCEGDEFYPAHQTADEIPQRELSHCNHLLFEYSRNNLHVEAQNQFLSIYRQEHRIDASTLSCILKASGCLVDQNFGEQVHCHCIKSGFFNDVSVGTSLLDMYMKTRNVAEGKKVFNEMPEKNVVSWTSLLSGYSHNALIDDAIHLFFRMQVEGIKPNPFTFATIFAILADDGVVEKGIQVHTLVIKNGFESTTYVGNSLITMYSKLGMAREALKVFGDMGNRNTVSWNGAIAGLIANGLNFEALELFYKMRTAGVEFTLMTFGTVIKTCANMKELDFAKQLHAQVLKYGFVFDHSIRTALLVAYTKNGEVDDAFQLFSRMCGSQNVVSWTAMIGGFLQTGGTHQAVNLFCQMRREGIRANDFTYSAILAAHPTLSISQVHAQVIKSNYENSPHVGTALCDAYIKNGDIDEARNIFEGIEDKDIVTWSAMLARLAQNEDIEEAVRVFCQLAKEGFRPNEFTYSSIINACATPMASVEQGKQFHGSSVKSGYSDTLCVSSALVTMYAKRGNIEIANEVFKRQKERDMVSWNSMVSGYAQHGCGRKALKIFEEMLRDNVEMDHVTFIGVISACTHTGLVEEGQKYFDMMVKDLHITPTMELYSCMVDLYSRAGKLDKAMAFMDDMPVPAGAVVWRTLLAACRVHRNLEVGKLAAEKLIALQPDHSAAYVLLSNLYASVGNWKAKAEVRKIMDDKKIKKEIGYSWIEVKNKMHIFMAGDLSHHLSAGIYMKLEELSIRLKDAGYRPDTDYVLHDVEDEHKEAFLHQHSERLTIAFGLIATQPGIPLHIVKNLRVCGDCHTVIKLISMLEKREIVVRDSNRFHHFKEGSCSCGDYW